MDSIGVPPQAEKLSREVVMRSVVVSLFIVVGLFSITFEPNLFGKRYCKR